MTQPPDTPFAPPWIKISSFDELHKHEQEILARLQKVPNGGNLFMIHPFLLLADIGVELSEKAKQEILSHQPEISGLSPIPYHAMKRSPAKQSVRYHLKGLFQRRPQ